MPPLVEGGVVGLPGDAGEQAQLVELRRPVAVRVAGEVDGKELRDEQQRLLAVLVRGVISQTLFITPYAYDNGVDLRAELREEEEREQSGMLGICWIFSSSSA